MNHHDELAKRISLVRRDLGNLLFHFTRKPEHDIEVIHGTEKTIMGGHASSVLHKILMEKITSTQSRNKNNFLDLLISKKKNK